MLPRLAIVLLFCHLTGGVSDVVSFGLQVPLASPAECVEGWQLISAARAAILFVKSQPWWKALLPPSGPSLALELLPSDSHFSAWESAQVYASANPPFCADEVAGSPCRVIRAAIIGPQSTASAKYTGLSARAYEMPWVIYGAPGLDVMPSPYSPLPAASATAPALRLSYTLDQEASALYTAMQHIGWRRASVVYAAQDEDSAAGAEILLEESRKDSNDDEVVVIHSAIGFDSRSASSISEALHALEEDPARVVVLLAPANDAAPLLLAAHKHGMAGGKGWTWIGNGQWVRPLTWMQPWDAAARPEPALAAAMIGALGVTPSVSLPDVSAARESLEMFHPGSVLRASASQQTAGFLSRAMLNATPAGAASLPFPPPPVGADAAAACPSLLHWNSSNAFLPPDLWTLSVFDAVWVAANAVADTVLPPVPAGMPSLRALPLANLTRSAIAATLRKGSITRLSPVTDASLSFLPNGDRMGVSLSLVNMQPGGTVAVVGTWLSSAAALPRLKPANASSPLPLWPEDVAYTSEGSMLAGNGDASAGQWGSFGPIIWPGGTLEVPPDRALESSHAVATAVAWLLGGIALSLLVGAIMHDAHVVWFPESAATIVIGLAIGLFLRFTADPSVRVAASFNAEFFMLALLPIIIFESGYSLDLEPFFTQLGSVLAFAVVGTTISAFVIGGIVYAAGAQPGWGILQLTFEEAMAFASFLSATDPVATLVVFSGLKVHPSLNALVYGESVINDAVGIVLYRTFTGFLVTEVTAEASVYAILSFLAILIFSVLIGGVFAIAATLAFRFINVAGQPRNIRWQRALESEILKLTTAVATPLRATLSGLRSRDSRRTLASPRATTVAMASVAAAAIATPSATSRHGFVPETPHRRAVLSLSTVLEEQSLSLASGTAETAVLLVFAYAGFSAAESVGMSGIVAVLFCGIMMNHYTRRVLTRDGRTTSSHVFKMAAGLADTATFLQIGLNVMLNLGKGQYDAAFITVTVVACLVSRAANVFPIAAALNCVRKSPISQPFQAQMWHAGLRGAIAFASALSFPTQHHDAVVNATSWICLFTIFAMGTTTVPLLRRLRIPYGIEQSYAERSVSVTDAIESSAGKRGLASIDAWMQNVLFGPTFAAEMRAINAAAADKVRAQLISAAAAEVRGAQWTQERRDTTTIRPVGFYTPVAARSAAAVQAANGAPCTTGDFGTPRPCAHASASPVSESRNLNASYPNDDTSSSNGGLQFAAPNGRGAPSSDGDGSRLLIPTVEHEVAEYNSSARIDRDVVSSPVAPSMSALLSAHRASHRPVKRAAAPALVEIDLLGGSSPWGALLGGHAPSSTEISASPAPEERRASVTSDTHDQVEVHAVPSSSDVSGPASSTAQSAPHDAHLASSVSPRRALLPPPPPAIDRRALHAAADASSQANRSEVPNHDIAGLTSSGPVSLPLPLDEPQPAASVGYSETGSTAGAAIRPAEAS